MRIIKKQHFLCITQSKSLEIDLAKPKLEFNA
jgi:hypothetical protein